MLRTFTYYVSKQHVPIYLSFIFQIQMIQGGNYIGCYRDNKTRDLDDGFVDGLHNNTPEKCIELCRKNNSPYAGVQFATQCFCGNDFGKYGALNESSCNRNCPGDKTKKCGGEWANNVYDTKVPQTSKTHILTVEPSSSDATAINKEPSTQTDATFSQSFSLSSVIIYENISMSYSTYVPSTETGNFPSGTLVVIIIIVILGLLVVGAVLLKRKLSCKQNKPLFADEEKCKLSEQSNGHFNNTCAMKNEMHSCYKCSTKKKDGNSFTHYMQNQSDSYISNRDESARQSSEQRIELKGYCGSDDEERGLSLKAYINESRDISESEVIYYNEIASSSMQQNVTDTEYNTLNSVSRKIAFNPTYDTLHGKHLGLHLEISDDYSHTGKPDPKVNDRIIDYSHINVNKIQNLDYVDTSL